MNNYKRIAAGLLGATLIIGLILFYIGLEGDPISRALAKKQAVTYAEKLYPEQDFVVDYVFHEAPFRYRVGVQSLESVDTHFNIYNKYCFFTSDKASKDSIAEHERVVESRWNTSFRMGKEAAKLITSILQEELPAMRLTPVYYSEELPVQISLCYSSITNSVETTKYKEYLLLDQQFQSPLLNDIPAHFTTNILWDGKPTEKDLQEVLSQFKTIFERNGLQIAYYNVTLLPDDYLENENYKAYMISSGDIAFSDIP